MLFNSAEFVIFMALVAALLSLSRRPGYRLGVLLMAGYVFYGAWDARFLPLLVAYTLVAWWAGRGIEVARSDAKRRWIMGTSVALFLAGLAFFKYTTFLVSSLFQVAGIKSSADFGIVLPLGISFFTFEAISYVVDVYRRDIKSPRSFWHFALFMSFFPRLVAGPIVRPRQFLPQVERPIVFTPENVLAGARLCLTGLVLKCVGADNLASYVDAVYANVAAFSGGTLLFVALCYSVQIFADFCGYSLIAIGLAKALGFELPVNFNMPYLAASVAEFWHRWHISLSTWLRDYLYIPLGGSRGGERRTRVNLLLTMVLGGLWHGASWNFIVWGFFHGAALVCHRHWTEVRGAILSPQIIASGPYNLLSRILTVLLVTVLWIPFRSPDAATTWLFLERIAARADGIHWIHTPSLAVVAGVVAWHLVSLPSIQRWLVRIPLDRAFADRTTAIAGMLLLLMFGQQEVSPFIYFQF